MSKCKAGDSVRVDGPVKYGGDWYDIRTNGTVQLSYPGSALVLLDYIAGDWGVHCIVRNKYISINEEDYYNEAI